MKNRLLSGFPIVLVLAVFSGMSATHAGSKQSATSTALPTLAKETVFSSPAQESVALPMDVLANAPYVHVMVNGRGPFKFEVDTGSQTSPFASELAGALGLDPRATDNSQTARITLAKDLSVDVPADFATWAPLWSLIGKHTYGDLGYPVLRHFVVEFDYAGSRLVLHDPATYRYTGPGTVFPASLEMGYDPQIAGEIAVPGMPAIPVRFTLDTGAGGTVISAPLVESYDLLTRVARKIPNPPNAPLVDGVNGRVFQTTTARIDAIRLGPYTISSPLVALSADRQGPFAMKDWGINLGGNILRRFKVIIDYPHNQVILEPNGNLRDPFPADASGLVLSAVGPEMRTIRVHGVVPGSPAERSGIKPGDVILSIDGKSTDKYALWQIQDLLKESGKTRLLKIRRGHATRSVRIELRALA